MIVEVHNKHLVFGITGARERQRGSYDFISFGGHAGTVIDNDSGSYWCVLSLEGRDFPGNIVHEEPKRIFSETGNCMTLAVNDFHLQFNQGDISSNRGCLLGGRRQCANQQNCGSLHPLSPLF